MKRVSNFGFPRILRFLTAFLLLGVLRAFVVAHPRSSAELVSQQAESPSLLSTADAVFADMSRITGLPIKAPLKKRIASRAEIQKYLKENIHTEYTAEELHVQQAALQAFGLVPPDFDLEKFLISFYTEQAAGFYDPRRKTMFMAVWVSPDMQKMVLAHELTHALQDQNLDLEKFLHESKGDDDATNARQAIVEGYATAAMMQNLMGGVDLGSVPSLQPLMELTIHQQLEEFPMFNQAPFFFRFQALFPYSAGLGFMQHGLAQGGWKRLNQVFSDPPTTTREIFEPQVYFNPRSFAPRRDGLRQGPPQPKISLPRPAALSSVPHLKLLDENVMGELGYYALLGQLISEDEAKSFSSAWLGDRYILYEGPIAHRYALVARTRWSSAESALRFFRDYRTILAHEYPEFASDKHFAALVKEQSQELKDESQDAGTTQVVMGSAASGEVVLLRKGDECLWAEGVPKAQADAMLNWLKSVH